VFDEEQASMLEESEFHRPTEGAARLWNDGRQMLCTVRNCGSEKSTTDWCWRSVENVHGWMC